MDRFIDTLTDQLFSIYGSQISQFTFVFPNQRSGLFFRKRLHEQTCVNLFSPPVMTINALITSFSSYHLADRTTLLFLLYKAYCEIKQDPEDFDKFYHWGETILNDFDDVDKWLVSAHLLFENIKDLRQLEQDKSYLSEEQIKVIRRFWDTFNTDYQNHKSMGDTLTTMEHFLATWELLFPLYVRFRELLHSQGIAYEGMIYRSVVEQIQNDITSIGNNHYIFVGLNALTKAETEFMEQLKRANRADFYWDYDADIVRKMENKASFYLKENITRFPSKHEINYRYPNQKPTINLYPISSSVGQAKQVYRILKDLDVKCNASQGDNALNTAIVLPDENMLFPILSSIPVEYNTVNVTMGYPLDRSNLAGFMRQIFEMQLTARNGRFYHLSLLKVLNHPYVQKKFTQQVASIVQQITEKNQIFVPSSLFQRYDFLNRIFYFLQTGDSYSEYLLEIIRYLLSDDSDLCIYDLEKEFAYHYRLTIERLQRMLDKYEMNIQVKTYFTLVRSLVASLSVPFEGEPLAGLQIMGILETRGLDFENLIITSMNDGVLPKRSRGNSFIPYSLRRGYGLSLTEHQEALFAYHFYRLISRAHNIHFLYDTRADENRSMSEVSRYVRQLEYVYGYSIQKIIQKSPLKVDKNPVITIKKDDHVMEKLDRFLEGGDRRFSASRLKSYIDCPLQFYFSEILELREDKEVSEDIQNDVFGSIFHDAMEMLYCGGVEGAKMVALTPDSIRDLKQRKALIEKHIVNGFKKHYYKGDAPSPLPASQQLIVKLLSQYIKMTLTIDQIRKPFYILSAESKLQCTYKIAADHPFSVNLIGYIDRIDLEDEIIRVIDYKTGKSELSFKSIEQLFTPSKKRPYQIFQVIFYAILLEEEHLTLEQHLKTDVKTPFFGTRYRFQPEIISLREIAQNSDTRVKLATNAHALSDDTAEWISSFREHLDQLFIEIFNPDIPFIQTPFSENCAYCPYTGICKRPKRDPNDTY